MSSISSKYSNRNSLPENPESLQSIQAIEILKQRSYAYNIGFSILLASGGIYYGYFFSIFNSLGDL
jgi:SP family sugar:H+ symporter-like MFS transporter